jgi:glycosyltransferase involved in cell wall biosynthesis
MPVVYRLGDVFVLPSAWQETWGLAINEAMASGRAIIASNKVGCAVDLVKPAENGFIFQFDNPDDLAEKMQKFTPQLIRDFGQKSLQIIENWTYERGIENLRSKLIKVLSSEF